jgi:hypothetical protein
MLIVGEKMGLFRFWIQLRGAAHPYPVRRPHTSFRNKPGARKIAELPANLRLAILGSPWLAEEQVTSIFFVPPQTFSGDWAGLRDMPEQALLFTPQGVLHVQASTSGGPARTAYLRGADLVYVHLSLLLLYGRLELAGEVDGSLVRVVVEYNTASHDFLQPALHQLLRMAWEQPYENLDEDPTVTILGRLRDQSLKFRNELRNYGLQVGERLMGFVFQPGVTRRYWGLFHRQVMPAALLALTDRQVIIVEEERLKHAHTYGWFLTFCPRACIAGFDVQPREAWRDVRVRLARGGVTAERQVRLGNEAALDWQELWGGGAIAVGGAHPSWSWPGKGLRVEPAHGRQIDVR